MRCMSLELVKGYINQIDQKVKISWIIPRVLDKDRIKIMMVKFDEWGNNVQELLKQVEKKAVFSN